VLLALGFAAIEGCSSDDELPGGYSATAGAGGTGGVDAGPCREGSQRRCGVTLARHGNVASCFRGTQICTNGRWSRCNDGQAAEEVIANGDQALQALSAPTECQTNPCDPLCRSFLERPDTAIVTEGGARTFEWQTASVADYADDPLRRGLQSPCFHGSDCQFNHRCSEVLTGAQCAHDKCEMGTALEPGCDACVQAICEAEPSCCAETTCAHPVCIPGAKLDASCDDCAGRVCRVRPECCTSAWDATCVELVNSACGANTCACAADEIVTPSGSCYRLFTGREEWEPARELCRRRGTGWDLATIDSPAENAFVAATIGSEDGTWIGLNDRAPNPEGVFSWSNGAPVEFTNWAEGEPNDLDDEDCTVVYPDSAEWNDSACEFDREFLCEGPPRRDTRQWNESCIDKVASVCHASCQPNPDGSRAGICVPWYPGQTDDACDATPDLALGAPCAGRRVPVCNHGTSPVAEGVRVAIFAEDSAQYPSCSPDAARAKGTCMTTTAIPPGECVTIECPALAPGDEIMVNPPGPTRVAECTCLDNWAIYSESAACGPPICSGASSRAFLERLNLYIVLDKSGSMGDLGKWTAATGALKNFFSDPQLAGTGVALELAPLAASAIADGCGQDSCDAAACARPLVALGTLEEAFAPADGQEAALVSAIDGATPGGSTPSLPALRGAHQWASARTAQEGVNVVVFVTDGEPASCLSGDAAATRQALLETAESAFVDQNVRTYVIGLQGANGVALHELARRGGTNQAFIVDGSNGASVAGELVSALQSIAKQNISCSIPLPNAGGFDPEGATVTFRSGAASTATLARRSSAAECGDGWYFDDNVSPRSITLCPSTCTTVQAATDAELRIGVGCRPQLETSRYRQLYAGACPPLASTQWSFLAYDTRTPGDSSIRFRARTAPTQALLAESRFIDLATAKASPDTQVCELSGPLPCPIDLYQTLGPAGAAMRYLELEAVLTPTSDRRSSPFLNDWQLTYSCPPSE
jgi:hypothetical protein